MARRRGRWGLITGAVALVAGLAALAPGGAPEAAAVVPRVVATIRPVHSLVAGVMVGVGEPALLIRGPDSPHEYTLRPSDARAVSQADVVVWVGPNLETFLTRTLQGVGAGTRVVALARAQGVELLPPAGGEKQGGEPDLHIWLDPRNGAAMAAAVAGTLAEVDPAHAARYRANLRALQGRLANLEAALSKRLAPVRGRGYVVYHPAYGYLERRFGLTNLGAVTLTPGQAPGARRVGEIRALLRRHPGACLFGEPETPPRLLANLAQGTGAGTATLDPAGLALEPGAPLYFRLLTGLVETMAACLSR